MTNAAGGFPLRTTPRVRTIPVQTIGEPRLRLTRRGRAVLGSLVALPLAFLLVSGFFSAPGLFSVLGEQQAIASDTTSGSTFSYVTVEAGQTLWSLAGDLAPAADPREVVAEIALLNQLGAEAIQPGQQLAIPARYAP